MILCIGPTPAQQRVMIFRSLRIDEVNRAVTTLDGAAGKSINVAKALIALGERPIATGFLGGHSGERLRGILQARGVQCDFVEGAQTRLCITVIDETNSTTTELVEESHRVEPAAYERLECIIRSHLNDCQAVIMSGTLTPGGPPDFYFRCTELANTAGALSIADTQGEPLLQAIRAKPFLVKPNRQELAAALGRELQTESAVMEAMRELHDRGAQRVVITAGHEPALAFDGRDFWRIVPPQINAVNPIGSGDTFTAALVRSLLRRDDLGEASRWGTAAGAANALTTLAGEIERTTVERLIPQVLVEKITYSKPSART